MEHNTISTSTMDSNTNTKKKIFKKIQKPVVATNKMFRLMYFNTIDTKPDTNFQDDSTHNKPVRVEKSHFRIQMFGINQNGETCAIFVDDMKPFFYIGVDNDWNENTAALFSKDIRKRLGKASEKYLISVKLINRKKLYDFTGKDSFQFLELMFDNMTVFHKAKNLWYTENKDEHETDSKHFKGTQKYKGYSFENTNLTLYETKIPPLLRYFHINNISPSGWIELDDTSATKPETMTTTCDYEYICSMNHITPLTSKEDPVPYKIACFDIEASSSHGDFPVPIKNYKRLASQIVDAYTYRVQSGDLKSSDIQKINMFLKKVILSAFGINGSSQNIDIVYPKQKASKEHIKSTIEKLLVEPILYLQQDTQYTEGKEQLKITKIFDKIVDDAKSLLKKDQNADEEEEEDAVVEERGHIGGFGSGVGESSKFTTSSYSNHTIKIENNETVIDVLCRDTFTREQKITKINEVMTILFPPLQGDEITFIGTTFMNYGEKEPYKNHCIVVGSCDSLKNVIIDSVDNERDCLVHWAQLIQSENPDIIIGYNIFGFDYEFMFQRSLELDCTDQFTDLSRIIGEKCYKKKGLREKVLEQTKNRLASGEYDLRYPSINGRLQIDLLFYFRRDYNLSSYKLDDVAGTFIRDDIKGIEIAEVDSKPITKLFSKNIAGLHEDDFIHIEISSFTTDYYLKGKKFKVLNIERDVEVNDNPNIANGKYNIISIEGHYFDLISNIKSLKWGMAKDDITPQDIFRLSKESAASRAIVAKYCIQDCNLVHHLMNKIDVLTGYIEMARICSVPISFLVFRGQGIKLTSYVAKVCREKNTLMPDLEYKENDDGYEGAIVLPPKCAMYGENPVACVDYSSLYPSIAKGWNLSPDSKVWTKTYGINGKLLKINDRPVSSRNSEKTCEKYDNLPGYHYINTEFDNFEIVQKTTSTGKPGRKEKVKCGKKVCRWALFPKGQEGIIPAIIGDLLQARKDTRIMAENEKDPFIANVLDKRQLGYKVTANSLYGQMGSSVSTFFEKDVAASITAIGRMMITYAKRMVEDVYGNSLFTGKNGKIVCTKSTYVYGDSVANYTPVYVKVNNHFDIVTIENLAEKYGNHKWISCVEEGKQDKEFCELDHVETWTDKGWTKLYRIIRHKLAPHKKMIRILTHTGLVDVTDDHSLILNSGEEISPKDCTIGTELLHNILPVHEIENQCITEDEARIMGYSSGTLSLPIRFEIMNSNINIRKAFFEGFCNTIGHTCDDEYIIINQKNQISASYISWLASSIGYSTSLNTRTDKPNIYRITMTKSKQRKNPIAIKKLHEIDYEGYVYDLTTENHHFAAGIGNLIVHNTDSVFFTFNLEDPETGKPIRGKTALEFTIEIAQEAAHLCSLYLPPPMKLAYEKTLMSFILLSKKRYVGMLYETDPDKGKLKFMGLPLKRRDSCDYLKDVYGGILTILMKEPDNIQKAIEFLNLSLQNLIDGKVSMEKLSITKALRSDYKNPAQIAHKVLAERIGERDPGNKPKPGDRIKFVFINTNDKKALLGERIETPEFILKNKLQVDYTYYITNQLMNPLQQMFGLALEKIYTYKQKKQKDFIEYRQTIERLFHESNNDYELFMKKREKYCSSIVKQLLFDPFLTEIYNKQNGVRTLFQYYTRK